MQITIKIIYADKGERPVQLPDSVPIQALAPAIANKLDLPQERLDGTVYLYHFLQDGELLDDDKTLAELDIEEGETIELVQERVTPQAPEEPSRARNAAPNARPSRPRRRTNSNNNNNNNNPRRFISRIVGCVVTVILLVTCTCAAIVALIYTEIASDTSEPDIVVVEQTAEPIVVVEVTPLAETVLEEQVFPLQFQQEPITNVVDMHYSPANNALLWVDANRLYEFDLVDESTRILNSFGAQVLQMRVSANGRYLAAFLDNQALYWRDLQTGEDASIYTVDDNILDLEINNDGYVLRLGTLGFVGSYTPNLITTSSIGNIESYDLQLMPDSFHAYGLKASDGVTSLQKYLVNTGLIEEMYGSLNGRTYNFCSPFWLGDDSNLLVTSCGEAAFRISDSQDTDMDFAFALPDVTELIAFADTANALLFLQAEQPTTVLVWPLDEQEPYEVAVDGGGNGRYIFTPNNTNTTHLIIVAQDEAGAYFVQITPLDA